MSIKLEVGKLRSIIQSYEKDKETYFDIKLSDSPITNIRVQGEAKREVWLTFRKASIEKIDVMNHVGVNCQFLDVRDTDTVEMSEVLFAIMSI